MIFTIEAEYVETLYRKRLIKVEADSTEEAEECAKRGWYNESEVLKEELVDSFYQGVDSNEPKIVAVEGIKN
jgi:hypothetical protein